VEPDAISGRFDGAVVRVVTGEAAGDDPRAQALCSLRAALLDPQEVNYVSEFLRPEAAGQRARHDPYRRAPQE